MINLSNKQSEIVNLNQGAFLVKASAGSGKTRVLTERIKRLVDTTKSKILAITFTNKAGEELRERLGDNQKIKEKVFVGTFHSFCQSVLELRFKLLGYNAMPHIFEDDNDRLELIEQAIKQVPYFQDHYKSLKGKELSEYKYKVLNFISEVKRDLISPEELIENSEDKSLYLLYQTYQDILESNNAIDFDDLVLLIYKLFINNEAVLNLYSKSYEYVCVDEAQDLNKAQYFLLKVLFSDKIKNILFVGDPNQSIYAFNGSSSDYMAKSFVKDFSATTFTLKENYRCSKSVIQASNQLMNLDENAVYYVINGVFEINELNNDKDEAAFVYNKIKELIGLKRHTDIEGVIDYNKISILARNKYVFKEIALLLKKNVIPFYYKNSSLGLKYNSSLMQLFDYYFSVKINPADKLHLNKLRESLDIHNVFDESEVLNSKVPLAIHILNFVEKINIDNLNLELNLFKDNFGKNLVNEIDEEERKSIIEDIEEFEENWKKYQIKNQKRSLGGFKNSISLGLTNRFEEENGVTLSTVHTMKGQESEIVFIIGMDDGTFPDYRAIAKGGIELQQEKNNAYVAFTRAKRFLFVTYPKNRTMPWGDIKRREKSRFLHNL